MTGMILHITTAASQHKLTLGYLEFLGQPSIATMILWPTSVEAWRVSMRIRGIRLSAGVNRCLVDCGLH